MKTTRTLMVSILLLSIIPVFGEEKRNYATNAVATVDMSVIVLKSETQAKTPPTKEELILKAKAIYDLDISNSYIYDNSEDLNELMGFIKKNKLEESLKKEVSSITQALERTKYEIDWTFYSLFVKSKGIGLLDKTEFESMRKKLLELQKIRAQKFKNGPKIKADSELIKYFEANYETLRQKQVEVSRTMCSRNIDWTEQFSSRRSQTETGWCYAFSYADYLEMTQRQSVSAADLVLQF